MSSLRQRLLWTLLVGVGVLLLTAAAGVYVQVRDEIDELFDVQLQQAANTFPRVADSALLPVVTSGGDEDNPLAQLVVEVRRPGTDAPLYRSGARVSLPVGAPPDWSTQWINGHEWRVYRADLQDRQVEVGQPMAVRRAAADEIAGQLLLPLLLAVPLVALLIWFGVGRALRPLERLARAVQQRSPADLAPLPIARLPRELRPLILAFNELMAHLERVLKRQKDFVADAAHELLTPLTALQLQVQLLERLGDSGQRVEVQADLHAGVARTVHLVRQLLALARQDPDLPTPSGVVDLGGLAAEVVETRVLLAHSARVDLGLGAVVSAQVVGDRNALRILLENLVDNAIKYTPAGGRVDVSAVVDGVPALIVADSGPGIPTAELGRVFDRFYRRAGQESTGSGLGLAIAGEVAMRHGARLTLDNGGSLGGLVAECCFLGQEIRHAPPRFGVSGASLS
ncbi:MAG TPA: ATP-binding protein [Nevskiaceae bacterium]|nr:ATP-binding protein [Nevskiaceae bacterium]